jgi:hypothetical protein
LPNPQAGGPPLVGCLWLPIQYFCSYLPYQRLFLHPQPEGTPCRGDRDPLITWDEIQHLQQIFKSNGYSSWDSQYALHSRNMPQITSENPMGVALLLYQNFTSNYISRLLAKHYIKTVHIAMKKTPSTLRPIKDDLCLKTSRAYCVLCECGEV